MGPAVFAVPIGIDPDTFRQRVAGCGYVYLAGRVLDDALDRHFTYKSKYSTLFAITVEQTPTAQGADDLAILSGLLLLADGLCRLSQAGGEEMVAVLQRVLQSFRRAVLGAMMEHTAQEHWNEDFYERLVVLKNVDFWRTLYTAVDPQRRSPLYPFLERYYALAQKFNDVLDFREFKRGQPNLLSVRLGDGKGDGNGNSHGSVRPGRIPGDIERELAAALLDLAGRTESMPATEQSVALLRIGESIRGALQLGLFAVEQEPSPAAPAGAAPAGLRLEWYSTLADVVAHWGVGRSRRRTARSAARTAASGSWSSAGLHLLLVSGVHARLRRTPRAPRPAAGSGVHHEHDDDENDFLRDPEDLRRADLPPDSAARSRQPPPRPRFRARAHHAPGAGLRLEVYGMDSSRRLVEQLESEFGKRLSRGTLRRRRHSLGPALTLSS